MFNRIKNFIKKFRIKKPKLGFDLWIDPGNASAEDIGELFLAIDNLYRAYGGTGLNFGPIDCFLVYKDKENNV